jgi:hypothetical protein
MVRSLKGKEHTMVVVTPLSVGGCCSRFSFHHFQLGYTITFRMVLHAHDWPVYSDWASATHKSFANGKGCKRYNFELSGCDLCALFQFYHFGETYPRTAIAGIFLVMIGIVLNFFYQKYDSRIVAEEELTTIEE